MSLSSEKSKLLAQCGHICFSHHYLKEFPKPSTFFIQYFKKRVHIFSVIFTFPVARQFVCVSKQCKRGLDIIEDSLFLVTHERNTQAQQKTLD